MFDRHSGNNRHDDLVVAHGRQNVGGNGVDEPRLDGDDDDVGAQSRFAVDGRCFYVGMTLAQFVEFRRCAIRCRDGVVRRKNMVGSKPCGDCSSHVSATDD